jgi:L-asparagine transporter-like permease
MTIRNDKGQFVSINQAMVADLEGFIADWTHWAKQALRKGDKAEAQRCAAEARDCRQKLKALIA